LSSFQRKRRRRMRIKSDISNVRHILEQCGFGDVHVYKVDVPFYVREWLAKDGGPELASDVKELEYFRISTAQGSFGILIGKYPAIDLKNTRVSFKELSGVDAPEGFSFCGFLPDTLKKFCELLEVKAAE
jgi:hypothetical protein